MSKTVTVALVGIAGYGMHFVNTVLDERDGKDIRVVAAVARRPQRCERLDELKALGTAIYPDLDAFYAADSADLVIISSPIHLHVPFTCQCLENGSNVLCEKPVSGTIQEANTMEKAEVEAAGFVSIGYQWAFARPVQALKKDIMDGRFGRPIRMKCFVSWPRTSTYYARNSWAGIIKTPEGDWVLDSPANNATAHYLFNMLYVLGATRETAATPVDVKAELYRANPIENFDSAAMRAHTEDGVEILFFTSHAVPSLIGPVFCYEFEEGAVTFEMGVANSIFATFNDGTRHEYGDPNPDATLKTWQSVESVRTGDPVACGIPASKMQTLCLNGAQDSMPDIVDVPDEFVDVEEKGDGETLTSVKGLQAVFAQCYNRGILPSEHGAVPWARAGSVVDLRGYDSYPGAK